jgi:hypothetical protein
MSSGQTPKVFLVRAHRTPIRRPYLHLRFQTRRFFDAPSFRPNDFFRARAAHGGILSWIRRDQLLIVGKVLDCIAFNTSQVPTGRWPIFYCRDRRERDFEVDMRIAISEARFDSVSQGWRITLQGERDERRPVLRGSSRRGQIWNWGASRSWATIARSKFRVKRCTFAAP